MYALVQTVIKKPDDNDAIERGVGLSMATAVEPMPVGLAGGSRYGIDPAQGGEGSLGMETLGVTPSSYEEGRRRVWSYAEAVELWLGISTDEAIRIKDSQDRWMTNRYPLIEAGMSRRDCPDWWASFDRKQNHLRVVAGGVVVN